MSFPAQYGEDLIWAASHGDIDYLYQAHKGGRTEWSQEVIWAAYDGNHKYCVEVLKNLLLGRPNSEINCPEVE